MTERETNANGLGVIRFGFAWFGGEGGLEQQSGITARRNPCTSHSYTYSEPSAAPALLKTLVSSSAAVQTGVHAP